MIKTAKRFTEILRPIYLACLVIFTLLREVVPLSGIMGNDLLAYAFFGGGILLAVLTFYTDRRAFGAPSLTLLGGFVAVCVLSTVVNGFAFVNNMKTVGWLIVFFFLIYVSGAGSKSNNERDITAVFATAVTVMGILTLVSLFMYIYDVDYTYFNGNLVGIHSNQGFSHKYMRLWGVFLENNYASTYGLATVFMSCYLFKKYRNIAVRILLVLSSLFVFSFMVLTSSRTVQVVSAVAVAWVVFYIVATKIKVKKVAKAVLLPLSAAVAAASVLAVFSLSRSVFPHLKVGVRNLSGGAFSRSVHIWFDDFYKDMEVNVLYGYLPPKVVETKPQQPEEQEPEVPEDEVDLPVQPEQLKRPDIKKDNYSNGRLGRWFEGLDVFSKAPVLGASPRGIREFAIINMPESKIAKYNYAILNFVIDIMASTGIVGIILIVILFVKTLMVVIKAVFKQKFSYRMLIFGAIALTLVTASMFQADLFFNMAFGGVAFWLAMGVINTHTPEREITDGDERVLVYGLKSPAGGVEHVVMEYVRSITKTNPVKFDFVFFTPTSLENEIEAMGGRVLYMPSRKRKPLSYKRAINRVFERNNYIAVWGNYSGLTNIDLLTLAYKHNVPVRIAHSHVTRLYCDGFLMKCFVNVFHRLNKFRVAGFATHFLACSDVAGRFMFPREVHSNVVVCKNAIDVTRFYPDKSEMRKALDISDDTFVVTHVARMCEAKNQSFLMEAFACVVKKREDSLLLMVGDGEKREEVENKAREFDIADKVLFLGERDDIPEILRMSDVFVLPSLSEGLGLAAIEAQACGLACVVSDAVPSAVDISGAVKFVSLSDNADRWADAIIDTQSLTVGDATACVKEHCYDISVESEKLYQIFKGN